MLLKDMRSTEEYGDTNYNEMYSGEYTDCACCTAGDNSLAGS